MGCQLIAIAVFSCRSFLFLPTFSFSELIVATNLEHRKTPITSLSLQADQKQVSNVPGISATAVMYRSPESAPTLGLSPARVFERIMSMPYCSRFRKRVYLIFCLHMLEKQKARSKIQNYDKRLKITSCFFLLLFSYLHVSADSSLFFSFYFLYQILFLMDWGCANT